MATLTDHELLRVYLGETIPAGGTDADTMFSNDDIDTFLETAGNVDSAAVLGWQSKAANLSHLVNVTEGPSQRSMKQRYENAEAMLKHYTKLAGTASGGTRIKDIIREGNL